MPVVSFLIQTGRCRRCGARLSWRYPAVEIVTGLVFGLIAIQYSGSASVALLVIASVLILLALIDLDHGLLPDQLTIGGIIGIVGYLVFTGQSSIINLPAGEAGHQLSIPFDHWLWGALIGAGILAALVLLTRGRGMGIGDIKLAGLIGASLGGSAALLALGSAFVVGAGVGLGLLAAGRAHLKSAIPFGPFLALGWLIAVLWHEPILAWYTGLS